MKNKITSFLAIVVCVFSLLSLSSCDEDDPYTSPLIGRWCAYYNNTGDIYQNDWQYNTYTFYSDGSGYYEYYTQNGVWTGVKFSWTSYNNNYVTINYYDLGSPDMFYYHFVNGYLEFSNSLSFYTYTGYSYSR